MIACDTSCLSLFLRRQNYFADEVALQVEKLIHDKKLALFGIVRQELLSGIKFQEQFDRIMHTTQGFPLFLADDTDHLTAAKFFNLCRARGVQGSSADFLICAMAFRRNFEIYTLDPDFDRYQRFLPIGLYKPS